MPEPAKKFEDLIVWQRAHAFVLAVYALTRRFPKEELFALSAQFRRAATSIAANIAEGFKKSSIADKLRFFNISQGSLEECRYYVILTRDLRYGPVDEHRVLIEEISRLLNAYMATLRRRASG